MSNIDRLITYNSVGYKYQFMESLYAMGLSCISL